jgi:hypothetical protein
MLNKAALFTALSLAILQPLASSPLRAQGSDHVQTSTTVADDLLTTGALPAASTVRVPDPILLNPGHATAGDILGARGPNPDAR